MQWRRNSFTYGVEEVEYMARQYEFDPNASIFDWAHNGSQW